MPEYCKHGVEMTRTCHWCGRMKVGSASDFAAKKQRFLNSIDRLEETVRKMQAELAKGPPKPEQPSDGDRQETEPSAPPTPPQRYPWQRG